MTQKERIREGVRLKYKGLCAYTGKPLGNDWQIDHITPKDHYKTNKAWGNANDFNNLVPAIKIINHYKRGLNLEEFRDYMTNFHERLSRLPKNTVVYETKRRKEYMYNIAELFEITPDKPFLGKFYFEIVDNQ